MIELISGVHPAHPQLILSAGSREIIGPLIEYDGQRYKQADIESSILQEMILPRRCCAHGTAREFVADICKLLTNLVGLDEKSASD